MNPVDRLVDAYDRLAAAQAAATERLTFLMVLLLIGVGIGVVLLIFEAVAFARLRAKQDVIIVRLAEFKVDLVDLKVHCDDTGELLTLVKGWAESARAHSKDAAELTKEAKSQTPDAERHVLEAVEQVPEKTARVVVDKLDELKRLLFPPLVLLSGLGGLAAASPKADAADDLRARNAATAVAWAKGGQ